MADKPALLGLGTRHGPLPVDDEQWAAVAGNDGTYDGKFFYAVATTGIFCRPSCKSKLPHRRNIGCFATAAQALAAGYRPCKRCKPSGQRLPDEEWIALATGYVDLNYSNPLQLQHLAEVCHGSPYHLHRTFKKVLGITPTEYIQAARIAAARRLLRSSPDLPISAIGKAVGLSSTPYFITLFKQKTGFTPASFRESPQVEATREEPAHYATTTTNTNTNTTTISNEG